MHAIKTGFSAETQGQLVQLHSIDFGFAIHDNIVSSGFAGQGLEVDKRGGSGWELKLNFRFLYNIFYHLQLIDYQICNSINPTLKLKQGMF